MTKSLQNQSELIVAEQRHSKAGSAEQVHRIATKLTERAGHSSYEVVRHPELGVDLVDELNVENM